MCPDDLMSERLPFATNLRLEAIAFSDHFSDTHPSPTETRMDETALPEFAILDDSFIFLKSWERKSRGTAKVHTFTNPDAFWARVAADPGFLARLSCVITDHYFDDTCADTGLTFAARLRGSYARPILLCTDGEFRPEDFKGRVDSKIAKDPQPWSELAVLIKRLARPAD